MNNTKLQPPPAPVGLENETEVLCAWLCTLGVTEEGCRIVVGCWTADYLNRLPKPKRKFKEGNFTVRERCRNLFYRKLAAVVGWIDRH